MNASKLSPVDATDCLSDSGYPQLKEMLTAYKSLKSGMKVEHAYRLIGTAFVSAMDAYCTPSEPDEYEQDAYASFIRSEQAAHARELKQ